MNTITLMDIQYQMETMLVLPKMSNRQFDHVVFYSNTTQESYAIELKWRNAKTLHGAA